MNKTSWLKISAILALTCNIIACSTSSNYAPVSDRRYKALPAPKYHIVTPQETLYSISWRYGWDFRRLANTNKIKPPYTIYPGQKIYFSTINGAASAKQVRKSTVSKQSAIKHQKSVNKSSPKKLANQPISTKKLHSVGKVSWSWPSTGTVISQYSTRGKVNKGVDIHGKIGQSVQSAASGKVVYAGSGLLGYGKLVIIKHNELFLSAYAHNSRLLVKENQHVKRGQKIAEMGISGTKEMLHFEIRREGKPVNPLDYLPKR